MLNDVVSTTDVKTYENAAFTEGQPLVIKCNIRIAVHETWRKFLYNLQLMFPGVDNGKKHPYFVSVNIQVRLAADMSKWLEWLSCYVIDVINLSGGGRGFEKQKNH